MALQSQYQSEEKTSPAVLRNYLTFPESILQKSVYLFFLFFEIHLLIRERERESTQVGGEAEEENPQVDSLPSMEPIMGLRSHNP